MLLASTGLVTIDALHWCSRLGVGVVVLAPDGTARLTSTPRLTDDTRLRRTQALPISEPYGADVVRSLISRKLVGHGKVLLSRFGEVETAGTIGDLVLGVEEASSFEEIRQIEAAVPGLATYAGLICASNPRSSSVSPRNLGSDSFERVLEALHR